ncbi:hypothetical protein [Streptococcus thermophilus]
MRRKYVNWYSKRNQNNKNRVALTPAGVQSLLAKGHVVLIETNASKFCYC